MPEGDTIHRAADRLSSVLVGATLRRFDAPRLTGTRPRVGERIETVEAVGKHLLIRFSGGLTLETHMRMTGSWHLYRRGERWRKAAHLRRCVIEVDDWVAVCFAAPVVRTFPTVAEGTSRDPLAHLGPDLCDESSATDEVVDECVERMARFAAGDTAIGDALLDQRIANGVGNVYRSEVCWACRVDPRTPVDRVEAVTRRLLIETAGRQLRANFGTTSRSTVAGGGLAVYGRRGRPCRRCGARVTSDRSGEQARVVYWCPACQDG